jgi:hypothetical protein
VVVELAIHRWDAQHAARLDGAALTRSLVSVVATVGIKEFPTESLPT